MWLEHRVTIEYTDYNMYPESPNQQENHSLEVKTPGAAHAMEQFYKTLPPELIKIFQTQPELHAHILEWIQATFQELDSHLAQVESQETERFLHRLKIFTAGGNLNPSNLRLQLREFLEEHQLILSKDSETCTRFIRDIAIQSLAIYRLKLNLSRS